MALLTKYSVVGENARKVMAKDSHVLNQTNEVIQRYVCTKYNGLINHYTVF